MSINTRQFERKEVLINGRLQCGGTWHECRIKDISAGGAKLLINGAFDTSGKLSLEIDRFGNFDGLIAWQNSHEVGFTFLEDPSVMADVVMGLAMYA